MYLLYFVSSDAIVRRRLQLFKHDVGVVVDGRGPEDGGSRTRQEEQPKDAVSRHHTLT